MRYKPGAHQYTQFQMRRRIWKLWWSLKYRKGFDILLTHSPAYQFNDGEDLPHRGFEAFRDLLDKYKPAFFIHGHVHMNYGRTFPRTSSYNDTQVINAFEKYIFDIDL